MSPDRIAIRVAARYAKDVDEAKRVFLMHRLSEARKVFYSLKARLVEAINLIPKLTETGKDHVYQCVGDHVLAVPDELVALEEALNAVALAASELEVHKLKEILPKKLVEEFKDTKDVRVNPDNPSEAVTNETW